MKKVSEMDPLYLKQHDVNCMHISFIPGVRIFKAQTEEKTPSVCALKMKQAMHTINGAPLVNFQFNRRALP